MGTANQSTINGCQHIINGIGSAYRSNPTEDQAVDGACTGYLTTKKLYIVENRIHIGARQRAERAVKIHIVV